MKPGRDAGVGLGWASPKDAGRFRQDIRDNARDLVAQIKASTAEFRPRNASSTPCPVCGRMLLPVLDRRGRKMLACQSLSCGYEQSADPGGGPHRPSPKEKAITRRLLRDYSDESGDTATLGDLLRAKKNEEDQRHGR